MQSVKKNLVANILGSTWTGLMSIVFVPLYIKAIGVESYAVIGIFVSIQAMLSVLDLGLSQTLNRELAKLSAEDSDDSKEKMANTLRTLEFVYWGTAIIVTIVVILLSNFVTYFWLNPVNLKREVIYNAFLIMAVVIGLRWPIALYTGGLNGLQKQITLNFLTVIFSTLQGVGALIVLWYFESTLRAFLWWQVIIVLFQVVTYRLSLWKLISIDYKGKFSVIIIKKIGRFALGMSGIAILSTILTQLDKILLSRILSLSDFGYYTFASTVAASLYRLIGPIFTAYYPRLTSLLTKKDWKLLIRNYHEGAQVIALVIVPPSLIIALFSNDLLSLWVKNIDLVNNSSTIIGLLILGNMLHGIMHIPYALQLASGWTKLTIYTNSVAVIFLVPAIYWAANYWGAIGASYVWILLNLSYIIFVIQFMHRRLLKSEKYAWYINDVGKPLLIGSVIIIIGKYLLPMKLGIMGKMVGVGVISIVMVISMLLATGLFREKVKYYVKNIMFFGLKNIDKGLE